VTIDNSRDLKVAVGVERSLQGSQRRNAVPPPTIEEVHESGTGRGVLMKGNPRRTASNMSRGRVRRNPSFSKSKDINVISAKSALIV